MKYLSIITLLFLSTNSFSMFCPSNFNQINIGDTLDQVINLCGNPSSRDSHQKITILSEEWIYYVTSNFNNATSKMTIIFANNKVINISIESGSPTKTDLYQLGNQSIVNVAYNNQAPNSVASTTACGTPVSLGDSPQKIVNICGNPALIKQNQSPLNQTAPIEVTELKYTGITPATLIFENGILKERNT